MSLTCSAPVEGHRKPGSASRCPVHGVGPAARTPLAAPSPQKSPADIAMAEFLGGWDSAKDPETDPETLAVLVEQGAGDLIRLCNVAGNPNTASETLVVLAAYDHDDVKDAANESINARICATLGIDESNTDAIAALRDQAWWDMAPESPGVVLAKVLSPNP